MITNRQPHSFARLRAFGLAPTLLAAGVAASLLAAGSPGELGNLQRLAAGTVDITDYPGTITDQWGITTGAESIDKVIENTPYYKYFTQHPTGWIQFAATTAATVTGYSVTSANDSPDRNPTSWVFEASTNGTTWVNPPLDSRTNQTFPTPFHKKTFSFANTTSYRYYRLRVTANNGSPDLQLGELQIFGTTAATMSAPAAPTGLTATVQGNDQILLSWNDVTRWETSYRVERSTNGTTWALLATLPTGTTKYPDLKLAGSTRYYYRVRAQNTQNSAWATKDATTLSATAPNSWTETWHGSGQNQTLTKIFDNGSIVIYRDAGLAGTDLTWVKNFTAPVWQYTQANYANLSGQRLHVVLHADPNGGGGFAMNVFDDGSQHKDLNDLTGYGWTADAPGLRDILSHEMGHIVEGAGFGIHGSPSYGLWGDSKWNEIFQYDAYLGTNNTSDATRWYNDKINQVDDYPVANSHWFRDWFYPIYHDHGGKVTLNKYFQLLSQHYHRLDGKYQRENLNWGEFVHFWSGAAGVNLKPLATNAFGWPAEWESQFQQAKLDYPGVTYTN